MNKLILEYDDRSIKVYQSVLVVSLFQYWSVLITTHHCQPIWAHTVYIVDTLEPTKSVIINSFSRSFYNAIWSLH